MKIAMLGQKGMPSREGGVEVVVTELATRMASRGHEVTVYNRSSKGDVGDEVSFFEGVRVVRVPTIDIKGMAALTSSYSATKRAIADVPDLIHFHAEGPCAMIGMAKRANIKTVATIHGLDWQRAKWGRIASKYIKFGEKAAATKADGLIVLSQAVKKYFLDTYKRDALHIPNGVELKPFEALSAISSKYGLRNSGYLLYLGRIVPEKGLHYLIDAYSDVKSDLKLIVAGAQSDTQGYYEKVLRKAAKDERVEFIGFVQGEDLGELYSNALLYVLPSDLEGMPISLLEAMSYGKCCVTSDIPECVEVLRDTGVFFEAGSIKSLKTRIESLLQNQDEISSLGSRARERIREKYDWENTVDQTLELYRKVLNG